MPGFMPRLSHRQSVLLRQFLQRHLRPCADVLDDFGCRERAEAARVLVTGAAHQSEQKSRCEQVTTSLENAMAYTGKPFACASSLSDTCGRAPMC